MATGKAIIYKGIPYFSDIKVPTRVSQLANDAGYLTTHQDISGKADKSATVSTVTWSNNKLTKTINGTTSDVVSAATILGNLTSSQVTTALGYTPASVNTTYDFESPDDSISFNGRAVGSVVTVDMTVEGKVSTDGDTISGDYTNSADFSEGGVYGKRVTTYGPWGIDIEEYVATSLWSRLSLRDSDILLTKTWDGTNTSLKSSITSLKQSLFDLVQYVLIQGTTSSSGALALPSEVVRGAILDMYYEGAGVNGLINRRDKNYLTCYDNSLNIKSNTAVKIHCYYTPIS